MTRILLTILSIFAAISIGAAEYNVRDFGAKGDGKNIDSDAINKTIEYANENGGGIIRIPSGTYLSYSIHLKSNITLALDEGAVIKAAPVTETRGYDDPEPNTSNYQDFGHSHWKNSLLWGIDLKNVKIIGKGLIDGTGVLSRGGPKRGYTGPSEANKALALRDCKNVELRDVSFLSCGHFALLLTGVDNLHIEGVTADTNRDGFDIDCCENVVIRNCKVNTINDDAIVLKCSYALGWAKPTKNVLIEDCDVSGYDVGSFLDGTRTTKTEKAPDRDGPTGRIKFGTESNGGFINITVRDCRFNHCRGLALETVDGAPLKNVKVSNLTMNDICNSPIYIRLGDRMRGPKDLKPSLVKNIKISNITATDVDSRYAILIAGLDDHPVKDVKISDVSVQFRGGLTMDDYKNQRGTNSFFYKEGGNYPEPSAHGIQPAWGISLINAENITFRNTKLTLMNPDERPMVAQKNTKNIVIK